MKKAKQIEEMIEIVKPFVSGLACEQESGSCELTDCRSCNARYLANKLQEAGYCKQRKGEWEKFEGERFICSNCAKVFGLGSTATIHDVKRVWNFCPNCGAKMKGEKQ